jgi:hypothetical protein
VISAGSGVEGEMFSGSNSRASSSVSELRLPDRLGISIEYRPSELLAKMEMGGVMELALETGSHQKVSLFHNYQFKLSNPRPSSNDPPRLTETTIRYKFIVPKGKDTESYFELLSHWTTTEQTPSKVFLDILE